ncbi:MAG: hypothetical protein IT521_02035 [Burkholderiales bacterium]|nr:hypothetical protein [Burkholderiales bacterium]
MTRDDALRLHNARSAIERATAYLVLPAGATRIGTERWRHEAAVMRDALLDLLQRHERTFADAARVLNSYQGGVR